MSNTVKVKVNKLHPDTWVRGTDWDVTGCEVNGPAGPSGCPGHGEMGDRIGYTNQDCFLTHKNICTLPPESYQCQFGMNTALTSQAKDRINAQVGLGSKVNGSIERTTNNSDANRMVFGCNFDLPDPNTTDQIAPDIATAMREYKFTDDQYREYMKQYCFSNVTSGCPGGATSCARYYQAKPPPAHERTDNEWWLPHSIGGGDSPSVECDKWSATYPDDWDSKVREYCTSPDNLNKHECDCNAASTQGSNFFQARHAFAKVPGQGDECWFEPCRRQQTQFLTKAQQDTSKCKGIDCANITVIQDSTIDNTALNQVVDCSCKVENGSCGPPASKGGCQSDSECSNGVKCITNQCGGPPQPPPPQPIENKCLGVICPSNSTCNPDTGICFATPPTPLPSDKCAGIVCINTTCDPLTGKCKDTPISKNQHLILVLVLVLVFTGLYFIFILMKKS